ncbi:MAG: LysO family transporter [Thermoproteus sp.]
MAIYDYLLEYMAAMGLGYVAGRYLNLKAPSPLFLAVVVAIIFAASAEGARTIVDNAGYILLMSLGYAAAVIFASALPLSLLSRGRKAGVAPLPKVSIAAVSSLLAGVAVGYFFAAPYGSAIGPILLLLLFLAGADIGALRALRIGPKHVLVPLASLALSLLAGLALYFWLGVSPAVAVGMGWYSFTGPFLLAASNNATLGAIGFLANFFREQLTFLLAPLLSSRIPPEAALAMGGATTMDNTLPLYRSIYGGEMVVPAVVNGVVLTVLVPAVVPLVYQLFP